jgi:DNA-binding response OmpR family regulator
MRILLVEDEERIASFVARGLKEAHYVVDVAKPILKEISPSKASCKKERPSP